MKKFVSLFLALAMTLSLVSCNQSNEADPLATYWLAGESVNFGATVFSFPPVFPELFRKTEWDGKDITQKPISRVLCSAGTAPYYEMRVKVEENAESYMDAHVEYFMMINGVPGNMEAWGITFGMTEAEVNGVLEKANQGKEFLSDRISVISEGNFNADVMDEAFRKIGVPREELLIRQYSAARGDLVAAYRNGKVYGMYIHSSSNPYL